MFEPQNPTVPPSTGGPFTPPPAPSPFTPDPSGIPAAPAAPDPTTMRTMPSRFLPGEPGAPKKSRAWVVVLIVALSVLVVGAAAYLLLSGQLLGKGNTNANGNTNGNSNATTNAFANLNANLNANANQNANERAENENANANVNARNVNTPTNTNANTNSSANLTTGSPLPSTADADSDGLTDTEETLYGSDPAKADTDGDGFIDGMKILADGTVTGEVALGYDPTAAGRKLDAAGLVRTYENTTGGYALWYPSRWVVTPDSNGSGATFVPDVGTGEFFQISVTDNPGNLTAKQWYQNLNPGTDLSNRSSVLINGLDAFQSLDQSTWFYSRGGKVYSLTYNTDGRTTVNYRTTFYMVSHSFRLILSGTNANTNG